MSCQLAEKRHWVVAALVQVGRAVSCQVVLLAEAVAVDGKVAVRSLQVFQAQVRRELPPALAASAAGAAAVRGHAFDRVVVDQAADRDQCPEVAASSRAENVRAISAQ